MSNSTEEAAQSAIRIAFGEKLKRHGIRVWTRVGQDGPEMRFDFEYHAAVTFKKFTPDALREFGACIDQMIKSIGLYAAGKGDDNAISE